MRNTLVFFVLMGVLGCAEKAETVVLAPEEIASSATGEERARGDVLDPNAGVERVETESPAGEAEDTSGSEERVSESGSDSGVDGADDASEPEVAEDASEPEGVDPEATWFEDCPTDTLEERFIVAGNTPLNVACMGSGPTVVFLHGFPEFHYSWKPVMDLLATEFRLVAPDQRGYNTSDKPQEVEAYTLKLLGEDILNLLPKISEEPVILVGHDWGGPVGWYVAHSEGAHVRGYVAANGPHPTRFADLIMNDPEQASASEYMGFLSNASFAANLTPEFLLEGLVPYLSEAEQELYLTAFSQPGAVVGMTHWYGANAKDPSLMIEIMETLSAKTLVPVHVLFGELDEFVLKQNAEGLEAYVDDLQVTFLPEDGHWVNFTAADAIADGVRGMHEKTNLGGVGTE